LNPKSNDNLEKRKVKDEEEYLSSTGDTAYD